MTAATVTEVGSLRAERIPALVSEKIMRFLNAGHTGTIELNVKEGRIRAFKVIECVRVDGPLDVGQDTAQD